MAFLANLATIVKVIPTLVTVVNQLAGWIRQANLDKFLKDTDHAFDELKKAKTTEEKIASARKIQRLFGDM